jgi:hypothetical protein
MLRRFGLVLLVLGALAAAGAWNYRRNLALEAKDAGPYRGYADDQLGLLASAYEEEVKALDTRYRATRDAAPAPQREGQLLDETVRAFDHASARSKAVRDAGAEVSMKEAALAEVRAEQARRRQDPLQVHLRRLTSF